MGVKQLPGVDIGKFIMAFAVVAIHVSSGSCTGDRLPLLGEWFVGLAVPFFFITSGYLLARKIHEINDPGEVKQMLRRRAWQLFRIFGYWLLIYLPITVYQDIGTDRPVWKIIGGYFFGILTRGESAYAWPLWFIYSMAIVLLLLSWSWNRKRLMWLLTTVFVGVTLLAWTNTFDRELLSLVKLLTIRQMGGGIYIISGMVCYKYQDFISKNILTVSFIAASLILYYYRLPFWQLMGGTTIFMIALNIRLKPDSSYLWLRSQSMWIYYLHMYPVFFIHLYIVKFGVQLGFPEAFLIASVASLMIAITIQYASTTWKVLYFLQKLTK